MTDLITQIPGNVVRVGEGTFTVRFLESELETVFPNTLADPSGIVKYGQAVFYQIRQKGQKRYEVIRPREIEVDQELVSRIDELLEPLPGEAAPVPAFVPLPGDPECRLCRGFGYTLRGMGYWSKNDGSRLIVCLDETNGKKTWQAIRTHFGLGVSIREARKLAVENPGVIVRGVSCDEAEEIAAKLKEKGFEVFGRRDENDQDRCPLCLRCEHQDGRVPYACNCKEKALERLGLRIPL